jgi:hypothetical protein
MPSILSGIFGKQWTIGDIMSIDGGRQSRAAGCSVSLVATYHELRKETILEKFKRFFTRRRDLLNAYYVIFKFQVISETGHSYTVVIRTQPDFNMSEYMSNTVQIFCSCPDFMYRSAWTLNQHGALFRSTGTDADLGSAIQNAPAGKRGTSTLCKHAYAALNYLVQNYSYLMGSL